MSTTIDHASRGHARLAPSDASRWLYCTAALGFCAKHGLTKERSAYSEEGTKAHEWAEGILRGSIPRDALPPEFSTVALYLDECERLRAEATNHWVELQVPLFYHAGDPGDHFGTCDFVTFDTRTNILRVLDLKYGKGRFVDAVDNDQLFAYAWSALKLLQQSEHLPAGPIEIHMGIAQPRNGGSSEQFVRWWLPEWEELEELEARFWERKSNILTGNVVFAPSNKACQWCPARENKKGVVCGGLAEAQAELKVLLDSIAATEAAAVNLDLEDDAALVTPQVMDLPTCARIYTNAPAIRKMLEMAEERLKEDARSGREDSMAVLVNGRNTNRKFTDDGKRKLVDLLGDKAYKPAPLIGLGDAEELLGKKAVGDLVTKPVPLPKMILRSELTAKHTRWVSQLCEASTIGEDLMGEEE